MRHALQRLTWRTLGRSLRLSGIDQSDRRGRTSRRGGPRLRSNRRSASYVATVLAGSAQHQLRTRDRRADRIAVIRLSLVRYSFIEPGKHRRRLADYKRWERSRPMELWQIGRRGSLQPLPSGTYVLPDLDTSDDRERQNPVETSPGHRGARPATTDSTNARISEAGRGSPTCTRWPRSSDRPAA